MSSHHIVREKQEPALLILDLTVFDSEHLGQLLEWSPTLIAAAPVADKLLAAAIHMDYLLTVDVQAVVTQSGLQTISAMPDEYLNTGLSFLIAKGYPAVNVITDSWQLAEFEPYFKLINLVLYIRRKKVYAIKAGFEKWLPAGAKIYIYHSPIGLVCKNLILKFDSEWAVAIDGLINISFDEDFLIIAEEI